MVRFLGTDGFGIQQQPDFGADLPIVPELGQGLADPEIQVIPDALGAILGLTGGAPSVSTLGHDDNLAEVLDESYLGKLGKDLHYKITQDIDDRKPWVERLERGMEMLGHTKSEQDDGAFPGASTVVMSLLNEAVVHHWALGTGETWPSEGPAKAKIWGEQTAKKMEAATRIAEYLNYQMTFEDDDGYREHARCMYLAPFHGCSFKKIYPDPDLDCTIGVCVEALDLIAPARATSLRNASRYAHRFTRTENEIARLVRSGFYREVGLGKPVADITTDAEVQRMRDADVGVTAPTEEDSYTFYECYVDLDVPGLEDADAFGKKSGVKLPYIVTIEDKTQKVLGMRRNWRQDDQMKRRRIYFVKYEFIPGNGFYGIGLIHLIGGLQAAATGALRELIDSGALASLQGGFVTKDGNLRSQRLIVEPGVWKPIDASADELHKAFFSPPFKEPSATLFQLLGFLIQRGEKFIGTTDIQTGDADAKAPVGSVIAILEQGAKVYTTIHRGYHNSMSDELRMRFELAKDRIGSVAGGVYPYDVDGNERQIFAEDFSQGAAIQPTADPNIFSTAQRLAIYQAVAQLAMQAPGVFKGDAVAKRLLQAMKVPDYEELLAAGKPVGDFDPVTENSRIMASLPVMAYPQQDHHAHIAVHTAFMQSPQFGANPQVAQHILPAMIAHVGQHLAHANMMNFRQAGVPIPPVNPMTGDYLQQPADTNAIAMASAQVAPQLINAPGLPPPPQPQDQPDPASQAKAEAIKAQSDQQLQAAEERHQQAMRHTEDKHALALKSVVEKAQADQTKTAIGIQTDVARAAADQHIAQSHADQQRMLAAQQAQTDAVLSSAERIQAMRQEQAQHVQDVGHEQIRHAQERAEAATDAETSRDIAEENAAAERSLMAKRTKAEAKAKPKDKPKSKKGKA